MSLPPGTTLGSYEILSIAGAGGMGEVYRARDKRLDRTVAIKVLPAHLSSNSDLKQRFEREAKAISNLNHPHICTLYDVGKQDGIDFLIMEYLDGETLADRLQKGAIPLQQTLTLSAQIADALDKAHRSGIVHRDLKPGNIMITKSGIKLLDFGLAKFQSFSADQLVSNVSGLATEKKDLTAEGTILGTLQYMAPEQLEGKDADARTDIFAFGSVMYEMLTGKRAFEGKSQASLIAAILEKDPVPINEIQPMAPPILDRIVRKCLEKDPDQRWQSAADVASQLKWIGEGSSPSTVTLPVPNERKKSMRWIMPAALAIVGVVAILYLMSALQKNSQVDSPVIRADFKVDLGPIVIGVMRMAISPDGKTLVYVGQTSDQKSSLYVRPLNRWEPQKLDGTEGAQQPIFSPDSKWIAFVSEGKLKKIPVGGGISATLYEGLNTPRGATWGPDNTIIFSGSPASPLKSVDADNGDVKVITQLDPKKIERSHRFPQFLPDGKTVIFTTQSGLTSFDEASIEAVELGSGKRHLIQKDSAYARYIDGYLVYCKKGILYAAAFDRKMLQLTTKPVAVLEGVVYDARSGAAQFSISDTGTLVYQAGQTDYSEGKLMWVDNEGKISSLLDHPEAYLNPRFSPDGQQLALQMGEVVKEDIWIYHFGRKSLTRLTFNEGQDVSPVWTPDGQRITYSSWKNNKPLICESRADGSGKEEVIYEPPHQSWLRYVPNSWSPDGRYLFATGNSDKTDFKDEIFVFDRMTGKEEPLFTSPSTFDRDPVVSPNSRWVAYSSGNLGFMQVYVKALDRSGGKWQVSTDYGYCPRWSKDGSQLFYRQIWGSGKWYVVDINPNSKSFEAGQPRILFGNVPVLDPFFVSYDVHPDGKRFVIFQPLTTTKTTDLQFVFNWLSELRKPTK